MRLRIEHILVRRYKTGPMKGQLKPFELPEGAAIVSVSLSFGSAVVYYTVPAS